jgi:hypothetical protein
MLRFSTTDSSDSSTNTIHPHAAFPFTFYNKSKRLDNYNQVPYLCEVDLHNVGVYRRLCQCFVQLAWGELSGELEAVMATKETREDKFGVMGLPKEMYPLSQELKGGMDAKGIESWEDWYKAVGIALSEPVALVFEIPLTVFYIVKKYAPPVRIEKGNRFHFCFFNI